MNILYGLYHADEGEICIHEKPVSISNPKIAQQYHIGMVHQHFMLIESMTVLQNIILGKKKANFLSIMPQAEHGFRNWKISIILILI